MGGRSAEYHLGTPLIWCSVQQTLGSKHLSGRVVLSSMDSIIADPVDNQSYQVM